MGDAQSGSGSYAVFEMLHTDLPGLHLYLLVCAKPLCRSQPEACIPEVLPAARCHLLPALHFFSPPVPGGQQHA